MEYLYLIVFIVIIYAIWIGWGFFGGGKTQMKKLLIILLLIIGCVTKTTETTTETITITLNTDEIKTECKVECKPFVISSNEWCDCMHQCSNNKFKIVPSHEIIEGFLPQHYFNRIYGEECWTDSTKSN